MKKNISLIIALLTTGAMYAQNDTISTVISVENDYTPIVSSVQKRNFTPQTEISIPAVPLNLMFAEEGLPLKNFTSDRNVLSSLPKKELPYRGYARMGYGLRNRLDAAVGYRYNATKRDIIDVYAGINGFNAERENITSDNKWNSRFYSSFVTAGYTHNFNKVALNVKADIGNDVFNYQPAIYYPYINATDKQHSNLYRFTLSAISRNEGNIYFNANAGYELNTRKYSAGFESMQAENRFSINGGIKWTPENEELKGLGADISTDIFTYNDVMKQGVLPYEAYTSLRFNPFIDLAFNAWRIRLGAHLDFLTNIGDAFSISPDVTVEGYIGERLTLYASATGGSRVNSFNLLNTISPYWNYDSSAAAQFLPSHKLFDVVAGGRVRLEKFNIDIFAGYALTDDDIVPTIAGDGDFLTYTSLIQCRTQQFYAGTRLGYEWNNKYSVSGEAQYEHWSCGMDDNLLAFKPALTLKLNGKAEIIENLLFNLSYTFTHYKKSKFIDTDIRNELNASLSYDIFDWLGVYLEGHNLLNSKYYKYALYREMGASALIGATLNF